jgi:hypothetical protein
MSKDRHCIAHKLSPVILVLESHHYAAFCYYVVEIPLQLAIGEYNLFIILITQSAIVELL